MLTPSYLCTASYALPFADKAKALLIPLLGYPSSMTVASLHLLAQVEFGFNSEASLYLFSGMAVRMACDIGLHLNILADTRSTVQRTADTLLWWSCLALE